MTTDTRLKAWRAVEALRAGVPNRDAVGALGSFQPEVEGRFGEMLATSSRGGPTSVAEGLIIAGDFGSGKSHLLEYLQHVALEQNFVCSKVVISKETPLHDPGKVYSAAVEAAIVPGKAGTGLVEVATRLDFNSAAYRDFFLWVNSPDNDLSRRFPATVYVFEHGGDPAISDRVIQFWSGSRLGVSELRGWLKALGEAASYKVDKVSARELALQRYVFAPRLIAAAGFSGWVVLLDEAELISHYSLQQRAKSYAEVARLTGKLRGAGIPGLVTVLSITPDFETRVLDERNDEEKVSAKLRADGDSAGSLIASQAERGMRAIRGDKMRLQGLTPDTIGEVFKKLRNLYFSAYDWEPPPDPPEINSTWRIRQHVKRWINEWDLRRLYPDYQPNIQVAELRQDYSEVPEMEAASESGQDEAEPH